MASYRLRDPAVPPGVYVAEFDGVEHITHDTYGDGLMWKFVIARGRFKGRSVARVTSPDPTIRNSCGRFLAALVGKAPVDGLEVDPADYEGELYRITVAETSSGGSRVESFVRERLPDDTPDPGSDQQVIDLGAINDRFRETDADVE